MRNWCIVHFRPGLAHLDIEIDYVSFDTCKFFTQKNIFVKLAEAVFLNINFK